MSERERALDRPAALFVLGMHRSGTSAIAGTVELAGVPLGRASDRMTPRPENPKGYWESTALALFNEEILEAFGGAWWAPPDFASGWTRDPRVEHLRDLGRALVATVHCKSSWGWKDPRNSLLLPFWLDVLDVSPVVLLSHRNPLEIAESLSRWRGLAKPLALALWERYSRSALAAARGLPSLVVPYDGLMREPIRWQATLAGFLRRNGFPMASGNRPATLVDRELRHSTQTAGDFMSDATVTEEQRELFRLLDELADGRDASTLSDLPPESPTASRLFAAAIRERSDVRENGRRHDPDALEGVLESAELDVLEDADAYRARLERERPSSEAEHARLRSELEMLDVRPRTSILCTVERDAPFLPRALDSLRAQIDPSWQLCVTDASGDAKIRAALESAAGEDPRIVVVRRDSGATRAAALNAALASSEGDLLLFFDLDDALAADALAEASLAFAREPAADLVYADEDRIDGDGRRRHPFFKPSWSPDFLLSTPYLGRPMFLRRAIVERLCGLREGLDGAEDYDLMLRATEIARAIVHVPKVLHHRGGAALGTSPAAARRAIGDALERRGETATVEDADVRGGFRVRRAIRGRPRVSIVIPFRDHAALLERSVRSIHELAGYDAWEALCVDNRSWQPETKALLRRIAADPKCRVVADDAPFNWSAINNRAVARSSGELVLFLNDDVEARRAGWLAAMIEHAQRDEVGAVGARLLYPNGVVQHAGIMLHGGAVARHPFRFLPEGSPGYFGMARLVRNVTAVTGACMMVRRSVFETMNGFDEALAVAYSDVDFCLRLLDRGLSIVYTPYAELTHHEGLTRGIGDETAPGREMARRWAKRIAEESYVSPSLGWRPLRLTEQYQKESST